MKNLSTLILVDCQKIDKTKAFEGISNLKYLNYLNFCKFIFIQMGTNGFKIN
jgi:hypothetical protein